jgi:hypothetical protein
LESSRWQEIEEEPQVCRKLGVKIFRLKELSRTSDRSSPSAAPKLDLLDGQLKIQVGSKRSFAMIGFQHGKMWQICGAWKEADRE